MAISVISAQEAQRKIEQGTVLIDIRQPDEYQREHIKQAQSYPLSQLQSAGLPALGQAQTVIFHCKSGVRTRNASALIEQLTAPFNLEVAILENGIEGWKQAGLPTEFDRKQPLEIMRQVQIVAGALVLIGVAGGTWLSPLFYGLSAFVGAGLLFAGLTGFCGMARLLAHLPWNQVK